MTTYTGYLIAIFIGFCLSGYFYSYTLELKKMLKDQERASQKVINDLERRAYTPDQMDVMAEQGKMIQHYQEQEAKFALWLKKHKSREIEAGAHDGKDVVSIILGYLGQEILKDKDKPGVKYRVHCDECACDYFVEKGSTNCAVCGTLYAL